MQCGRNRLGKEKFVNSLKLHTLHSTLTLPEGRLYGTWPGLHPDALDKGVDLAVTTDYRNVLSNVLKHQMGVGEVSMVFPGFEKYNEIGLF